MLAIDSLYVHYGRIAALKGVSVRVHEGELVAVIGPNGAGKSTMLATIAGLVSPTSGTVNFQGESLIGVAPDAIVRRGISLVPEGRRILGTLTVSENLRLGATSRKDRESVAKDLDRILELFPTLGKFLNSMAGRLSGGEQQQLAIARALLSRPRLLLIDEPSLGLAPQLVDRVFRVLEELRSDEMTVLLVEQNAQRATEIADRVYLLRSGNIDLLGAGKDVLKTIDFGQLYFGLSGAQKESGK